jgi:hypothetical protein
MWQDSAKQAPGVCRASITKAYAIMTENRATALEKEGITS